MRRRAPTGWKRIDIVQEYDTPVFTPKTAALRKKEFKDCDAFVHKRAIFVESEEKWLNDPGLRAHEIEHLNQEHQLGKALVDLFYNWCQKELGYEANPFEVGARLAAKRARK